MLVRPCKVKYGRLGVISVRYDYLGGQPDGEVASDDYENVREVRQRC